MLDEIKHCTCTEIENLKSQLEEARNINVAKLQSLRLILIIVTYLAMLFGMQFLLNRQVPDWAFYAPFALLLLPVALALAMFALLIVVALVAIVVVAIVFAVAGGFLLYDYIKSFRKGK